MDYTKTTPVDNFLNYKGAKLDSIFSVKVEILLSPPNHWLSMDSEILIQNVIAYSDYKLIFMDELLLTKPYLEYAEMGVNFLDDVKFEKPYLSFTNKG